MAFLIHSKLRVGLLALAASLFLYFIYYYGREPWTIKWVGTTAGSSDQTKQTILWQHLQPLLEKYKPDCPSPTREKPAGAISFNVTTLPERPDVVHLPEESRRIMERAHSGFVNSVRNSTDLKSFHIPGTSGLVSAAGASYLPLAVISVRMLRRTGSTLPVELFLRDSSEYESKICDNVLPSMNARCVVLTDIMRSRLGSSAAAKKIAHFQLKIFAMLFSSFENVLWMDSDCFPLHDPALLLNSEPFVSKGLVMWPDFWASTTSPLYYNISGQPIPPMDARQASETGVLMVSKKTHFLPLALAAYYNYYGPSHYFMLLSQGGPGEGDKDTFLQACTAIGGDFYTVSESVKAIGHEKNNIRGTLSGSAMVQTDPIEDFSLTSQNIWRIREPSVAKPPRIFFVHAHYPKFNPGDKLFGYESETAPTMKQDGTFGRAWVVPKDQLQRFGYDAEKAYWEEIKWVSCNLEKEFKTWIEFDGICGAVELYWSDVFEDPREPTPSFTMVDRD